MTLEELTQALSAKRTEYVLTCQQLQKDYLDERLKSGKCFTIGDIVKHSRLGHIINITKIKYNIASNFEEFIENVTESGWEPRIDYHGTLLDDKLATTRYGSESPLCVTHSRAALVKKGSYNGPVFISK